MPDEILENKFTAELSNIDDSEIIEPLRMKPKRTAQSEMTAPPVMVGDEKVLSNEALPHSISDEPAILLAIPPVPEERAIPSDLFYEEGQKAVIPENPYLEILSKYRNPPLE